MAHEAIHQDPVWRDRADFILGVAIDKDWEQLWAERLGERLFRVCCIPFFAYDLHLADEVEAANVEGRDWTVTRVARRSDYWTYRAWFGESVAQGPEFQAEVAARARELGCEVERSSPNLLAFAAPSSASQLVADLLYDCEQKGQLIYETGQSA